MGMWAFLEQYVFQLAEREGFLAICARKVEQNHSLKEGYLGTGLIWQTRVLSWLYMMVLFPREYWELDQNDLIYRTIENRWSPTEIRITTQDENVSINVYDFIRHLRNAIAHANIRFYEDDSIEFWDKRGDCIVYQASMSKDEFMKFLNIVGAIMANQRNRAESKQ